MRKKTRLAAGVVVIEDGGPRLSGVSPSIAAQLLRLLIAHGSRWSLLSHRAAGLDSSYLAQASRQFLLIPRLFLLRFLQRRALCDATVANGSRISSQHCHRWACVLRFCVEQGAGSGAINCASLSAPLMPFCFRMASPHHCLSPSARAHYLFKSCQLPSIPR